MVNSGDDADLENREIRALLDRRVDGIVYAAEYHRLLTPPAVLRGVPTVLLDARSTVSGFSGVVPDEVGGAMAAVRELVDHGHGASVSSPTAWTCRPPACGSRDSSGRCGTPARTYRTAMVVSDLSEAQGGYRAAAALLDRPEPIRPTALFCYNDRMAMGAYQAAAERGLRIPQDLSIVGFDDQEIISAGLRPGLTTVALPHYEMGWWAVTTLLRGIDAERKEPPRTEILPCPLVRRASVGPPPRS